MNKVILFLFAFVVLLSCNTAKHLEKQQKAIESLTNKVNASKVIQIKDSTVFKEGVTQSKTDTIKIFDSVAGVERYYFYNNSFKSDTLKIYYRDAIRENALFTENETNKALVNAANKTVSDLERKNKNLLWMLIVVLFVCGFVTGAIFKFKIL